MQIKEGLESEYRSYVEKNSDPYGAGVITFTERWAGLMESKLAEGLALESFANQASHDADTEGITGFMFGCAVGALARFWIHGEELRVWHNLKTQIGKEGEVANKNGGVLNPALLTIQS